MIKAVIFDMDGVLVDSEKHQINVEIATLKEFGLEITHDIARDYMGLKLSEYFSALKERFNSDFDLDEAVEAQKKAIAHYYAEVFPLVPHARKLVEILSEDYLLGLSTSSSRTSAESVLNRHDIMKYFGASTCGNEVQYGKPDPEIFQSSMDKLGVTGEECVVIEDSVNGMHGAKATGAKVIARKAGHNLHQDFSVADFVVEDLLQVFDILTELNV
jgi:HAD superfamily hydrolase (TIGR01509 family)